VPGMQRSVLQSLSAQGFAAYAVDLRGYGETPRAATGGLPPRRASTDIVNVVTWVGQQHPTLPKPALIGWSRGAAASMMAAQAAPARISALVMFGFVFDPDLEFVDVAGPDKPQMLKNTKDGALSDFISPRVSPPAMTQAFAEQALRADPVLMDLKNDGEFSVLEPSRLTVPTLVLFGEHDPGVIETEAAKFWGAIAAQDKQLVMLPGSDHAAQIEDTHDAWIAAVVNFLTRPPARR
jgi:pimeloyl-ACP methyl ester carboxylesterase